MTGLKPLLALLALALFLGPAIGEPIRLGLISQMNENALPSADNAQTAQIEKQPVMLGSIAPSMMPEMAVFDVTGAHTLMQQGSHSMYEYLMPRLEGATPISAMPIVLP